MTYAAFAAAHPALVAAYALCAGVLALHGLHLAALSWRALRGRVPAVAPPAAWPHVVVQLPLYNEAAVAERLLAAVAAFDYPSFCIQVLDDSTDDTGALVAEAAARLRAAGVHIEHLRRGTREGFKAGALAHGLARTGAPFAAVFDADFVPPPDLLRRLVAPLLADDGLAFAQARWTHRNGAASRLTRLQAYALDAHFAVEQHGRSASGLVFTFNGTAGVWRTQAIRDAGGWSGDTLAEDFDLSVRAQARGWRGLFLDDVEAPADLPGDIHALRAQQQRWARGTAEVARHRLSHVAGAASLPAAARAFAIVHLFTPLTFWAGLGLLLLYAPVVLGGGVPAAAQALGGVGLAGVLVQQAVAAHRRGVGVLRGIGRTPLLVLGMTALVPACAVAVARAFGRRRGAFERTPKSTRHVRYRTPLPRALVAFETALFVYVVAGAAALVHARAWEWLPFQGLLVASGAWLLLRTVVDARNAAATDLRPAPRRTFSVPVYVKSPHPESVGDVCPP